MAGNELLDFVDRGNFDFFKFSTAGDSTSEERDLLKSKCQHVLEYAHATVQDMCLLGFNLSELKRSRAWQDVINPESGYAFLNHSFEEFCKHAFGFSETRTSNFLRIAQFVKISGSDTVDFIEKGYEKYNTSQLIELAAVPPQSRKFFNPDMSVKDMRAAKNYIKMGSFFEDHREKNFDLMQGMKAWEERKAEKERQKQDENDGQIPGQMSLENLENLTKVFEEDAQEKTPTSDLAEDGGAEAQREKLIKDTLVKYTGYERKRLIYNKYNQGVLSKSEFADFVKEQYGLSGHYVDDNCTNCNSKGIVMELRGKKQEVLCEIFLTWATVAARIAKFIENGEYWSEEPQGKNPTSDLAELGGADFIEDIQPVMPEPVNVEEDEPQYLMRFDVRRGCEVPVVIDKQRTETDVCAPMAQQKKYSFNTREDFRAFLKDYANWENIGGEAFCENVYKYVFKNGITIFALVQRVYVYDVFGETIPMITNMLQDEKGNRVVVYQDQIERFYRDYKGEL